MTDPDTPIAALPSTRDSRDADVATVMLDHLRRPLRDYFDLPPRHELPKRLADLLTAFEAALGARGDVVTAEFRDGLMKALPALRTFAVSLAGDPARADDLVQETLLKAWSNHHRFEPGTRLVAWLFTIMRNLFYSEIRKRKREVEDADGVHAASLTALPDQEDAVALHGLCQRLTQIPSRQRDALLLVGAEGFTYEEAAAILNCQVGTVKSRVSRARSHLLELLAEPSRRLAIGAR